MMTPLVYEAINEPVLSLIPRTTQRLLDIGCGSGAMGQRLKERINCEIVGVTFSPDEAAQAEMKIDRVLVQDLNHFDPTGLSDFDCIMCSHVLEHLYEPQVLLEQLRSVMSVRSTLIVALPNVLNCKQRYQFLRGNFRYTQGGLMDSTHFRFFDWNTAAEMVKNAGYKISRRVPIGHVPLPIIRKLVPSLADKIDRRLTRRFPGLFADQFIVIANLDN